MAVNSEKNYYIHPRAVSFTPNYQGHRNIVYVSIVSNAAIKVYHKDVAGLGYGVDAEYQTWRLSATTTALGTASAYFIYARLSRTQKTADIIFSVNDYSIEGEYTYTDSEGNEQTSSASDTYYYIKIGTVTATDAVGDDATVNRELTYESGELGTDKQINEQSDSVFEQMFEFVTDGVTKLIRVKEMFESIRVSGAAIFNSIATFAKGFALGDKTITNIATSEDGPTADNSTLPTTGYVAKEIESLDDHFLIKDKEAAQEVGGDVTFKNNVAVAGAHSVGGDSTIDGKQVVGGNVEVGGSISAVEESSFAGGSTFGEFLETGGTIQGAHIDGKGFGKFAGLKSDYFEIFELIYNIQTARKGEEIFSDAAVVESVEEINMYDEPIRGEYDDNDEFFKGYCHLKLRSEHEGYMHTFRKWDVLYGRVNQVGESGEYAIGGIFWGRIAYEPEKEEDSLALTVEIYADSETGSININPTAHMAIARRGNKSDVSRQNTFYISTEEGNITQLLGVTKPLIDVTNTGAVLGLLPKHIRDYVTEKGFTVNAYQPYLYVRGLIAQDFMQLDYLGLPIKSDNYRGEWNADTAASETGYYRMTATLYDTVTYGGSIWECVVEKSDAQPPSISNANWRLRVSKGDSKIYELKPNVNIIYLHDKDNASIDYISLVVSLTNTDGYTEITDSTELAEHGLKIQYSYDGETAGRIDLTLMEAISLALEDGGVLTAEDGSDMSLEITIENIAEIEKNITFYLVDADGNDIDTVVIPVVRDGIQGKSGPLPYPCGVWSNDVAALDDTPYVCTDDSTVYVLWPDDNETGTLYVRTTNPMRYTTESDGTIKYWNPAEDWGAGGSVGWRPMTKFEAINVNMLAANWARFGNKYGGVFYEHYLFSAYGVDNGGVYREYSKDMFNEDGTLRKSFIPSLFLDLMSGLVKTNKLSETFVPFNIKDANITFDGSDGKVYNRILYANEISYQSSYNVRVYNYGDITSMNIVDSDNSVVEVDVPNKLLTMPNLYSITVESKGVVSNTLVEAQPWEPDGVHSTIIVEADASYSNKWAVIENSIDNNRFSEDSTGETYKNIMSSATILCADPRLFDKYSYRKQGKLVDDGGTGYILQFAPNSYKEYAQGTGDNFYHSDKGYFVVNGVFTKFLFLEPGTIVKLRSCTAKGSYYSPASDGTPGDPLTEDITVWYVENASDFAPITALLNMELKYAYDDESGKLLELSELNDDEWQNGSDLGLITLGGTNILGNNTDGNVTVFGTNRMAKVHNVSTDDVKNLCYTISMDETPRNLWMSDITEISSPEWE